jgi:AcrR family transcriptional regulator
MAALPGSTRRRAGTAVAIIRTARRLLERDGPDAVTMRAIATAVGVTPMAIYKHYADRDALLSRIADEGFARLGRRIAAVAPGATPRERIIQGFEVFLAFALARPRLTQFMFWDPRPGARRFPDDFRLGASPTARPILAAVQEAMDRGSLGQADPVEIAVILAAEAQGLVAMYLGGRFRYSRAEFRRLYRRGITAVLDGLAA